jgi:vitamin K-dependent gamma-carboxylase
MTVGYHTRSPAALFFAGFTYVELMDVTNYLNHYYLASIVALLLAIVPSGRVWSLDARRDPAGAGDDDAGVVRVPAALPGGGRLRQRRSGEVRQRLAAARPAARHLARGARPRRRSSVPGSPAAWLAVRDELGGISLRQHRSSCSCPAPHPAGAFAVLVFFHFDDARALRHRRLSVPDDGLATIFFEPDWPRTPAAASRRRRAPAAPASVPRPFPGAARCTASRQRGWWCSAWFRCCCRCAITSIRARCSGTSRACAGRGR